MSHTSHHSADNGAGIHPSRSSLFKCRRVSGDTPERMSVIRPELAALTGNPLIAVVLNQILYWTERLPDINQLIEEEFSTSNDGKKKTTYGWFYKSTRELIEETLLGLSRFTMRNYLQFLINEGWISERANPINKWDRTTQYRVNLKQLQGDLLALGFELPGLPLGRDSDSAPKMKSNPNSRKTRVVNSSHSKENPLTHECREFPHSNVENSTVLYLTETTTKKTNKDYTSCMHTNTTLMVDIWRRLINPEPITLTDSRKAKLECYFQKYFEAQLSQWDKFCQRIQNSSFLMGEGPQGWRISLDWVLLEANFLKVREGNYDSLNSPHLEKVELQNQAHEEKSQQIIASIKDPLWQDLCSQFSKGLKFNESQYLTPPLTLEELRIVARASFLNVEDEKLIWLGSSDPQVLNKIEDLRLKLSPYFSIKFPHFRTIRTRLIENSKPNESITERKTHD